MRTIICPGKESWPGLCSRAGTDNKYIDSRVRKILGDVKSSGDRALALYSEKYDRVCLNDIKVPAREIGESSRLVSGEMKKAMEIASGNIDKFHRAQVLTEDAVETMPGVKCWRKSVAVEKAGLYIPGGTAPLFSSVLMLGIPAKIAGCSQVILCTPPDMNGNVNPHILYAASLAGISDIFRVGGAQAIAAMAYGTETVPKVNKIFGPGNHYVTRAKEMVQSEGVAIDMPAGPSEVLVIADETADPEFVAADLLSQAEHGPDSQVVLVSDSEKLIERVKKELKKQLIRLPRKDIAGQALGNSFMLLMHDLNSCIDFSNEYAPEHLIINTAGAYGLAEKVINAGSVFLGSWSCESAGDYASGTNHTLPTAGYAKSCSGVSVESFMKKITFQELTAEGIRNTGPAVELMAGAEGLSGHGNAIKVRLEKI